MSSLTKNLATSSLPEIAVACTFNLASDCVVPIPTSPTLLMTNCVVSGLVPSSTTNELPVPVCVILTKSSVVDPEAIIKGPDCDPETCNLADGPVTPIPTLPVVLLIVSFSPQ